MRWTKITSQHGVLLYWECVFVNVPFKVIVSEEKYGVDSILYFTRLEGCLLDKRTYKTIKDAKSDVESFVLEYLGSFLNLTKRECLETNVMTWRKLKEQLDEISEDQLDLPIHHLDTDGFWVGEPQIKLAEEDQYMENDCRDCTGNDNEESELVVEKGMYFLSTCNI